MCNFVWVRFGVLLILRIALIVLLFWFILHVGFFTMIIESFKLLRYTWTMRFVIVFSWLNAINIAMIKKVLNLLHILLINKHFGRIFINNLICVTLLEVIDNGSLSLQLNLRRVFFWWLWRYTSSHSSNYC